MFGRPRRIVARDIDPDEIFVDSTNRARFDTDQFEGKIEKSLGRRGFLGVSFAIAAVFALYGAQAVYLQWWQGVAYAARAENNQLAHHVIFANRGLILDRAGRVLAGNATTPESDFGARAYGAWRGISAVVGYAKPPAKDAHGNYFRFTFEGETGAEATFNDILTGKNGQELTETDALQRVVSQSAVAPAVSGSNVTLSIDAELSQALYDAMERIAAYSGFIGGASVLMDVHTGEIIALVSYPEYPLQVMGSGTDAEAIKSLLSDTRLPFLNRATQGLFAPGSVVKPYVGIGALMEGVIDEHTQILSTGSLTVPNPYHPDRPTVFKDWRAHGLVDMRRAIAVSSDVYFYQVGGGYPGQRGLGITKLAHYYRLFGFGSPTGIRGFAESGGNVPDPAWKKVAFPSDQTWRLGDTYHTSIGQYGMQVTPLQVARATAALVNGGKLITPTLVPDVPQESIDLGLDPHAVAVVREGMRMTVTDGIAGMLNFPYVTVAGKTGTAQVGVRNERDNSNIEVFFPYENPKYVLVVMMEKAPPPITRGATNVSAEFIQWLYTNAPQYLGETI